ncbi:MAG: integrase [Crenarchaeota archaeon]|nr:MAG: integrase [Thermoproteota archaeon]RDJ33964.1 MAG: integrase [Thermoproteota archaeon]RDJ36921.1 MAG: integrase [Thermoproteota archaeon]RDJ37544.1 MAG: integrase [Thermoproteota archaeon]
MSNLVQKERFQIHNYDGAINSLLSSIEKELSTKNSELILKYDRVLVRESLAKATRRKHLEILLSLSRLLKKDWHDVTKDDVNDLVFQVMQRYSPETGQETNSTWDHKKILKIFFRWFKLGDRQYRIVGDPEETKNVRLKEVRSKIVREDLITQNDVDKLLRACRGNLRDKALIHVHAEAGTRPGEILSLRIKHVKFDDKGAVIHVDGKTGPRPVRLVTSVPSLASWIDSHPFKEITDSPLWIKIDVNHYGEPMSHATANKVLQTVCKRAGITKKINLKLFRHSEATETAKYMTEAQMRIRHGWTSTSKMPANYVHLVSSDVEQAYLKHLGMADEPDDKPVTPKICHICKMPNSSESEICNKCGKPLDLQKALDLEEKASEQNFVTNKLAGKILIQMLMTGKIPKLPENEIKTLIQSLNL